MKSKLVFSWLFAVWLLASAGINGADPLDHWSKTANLGPVDYPRSLKFAGGLFFVSAGKYRYLVSTNALDWTEQTVDPNAFPDWWLMSFTYGNGLYLAAGIHGGIYTSADGLSWQRQWSGIYTQRFSSVTFGGGQFVAVGGLIPDLSQQVMIRSYNGTNWTTVHLSEDWSLMDVCFAKDHFCAVGNGGVIFDNWGDQQFAKSFSTNLNQLTSIACGNNLLVSIGPQATIVSSDGMHWTSTFANSNPSWLWGVAFGGGSFAIGGENGLLLTSQDGLHWSRRSAFTEHALTAITFGNGSFVTIAGDGSIFRSDRFFGPPLSGARVAGTDFSFQVTGATNQAFKIQAKTNLIQAAWEDVFTGNTGTTGKTNFIDKTASTRAKYYRTMLLDEP